MDFILLFYHVADYLNYCRSTGQRRRVRYSDHHRKLEEAIFGIFRLGWGMAKGVAKKIRMFSRFVVKSVKELIKGFEELIKFLKGEKDSFKKIIDEVFEITKKNLKS